ncbi:hypothetical protein C6P45_001478 [Maudiozyma exigua]|uniref:Vacuolar membrane protein n=1 Tax=Maudiozyma exigua TaxID=34358 RepID=A0A9P7BCH8_MAUEX|nr:hypothetical protein C6P45_001478 [Kazachstania exigua]
MIVNQLVERALPKLITTTSTTSSITSTETTTSSNSLTSGGSSSSTPYTVTSSSFGSSTSSSIPTVTPPSSNDNPFVFHSKDAPLEGPVFIAMGSIIFSIFLICGIWWIISTYLQIRRTRKFKNSEKYNSLLHTYNDSESNDSKSVSEKSSDIDIESQFGSFEQSPQKFNDSLFQTQNLFVSPTVAITKLSQTQRDSMISLTSVPYRGAQLNDLDTTPLQTPGSMVSLLSPLQSPNNSKYYSYQSQLKPQLKVPGSNNRRSKIPSMYLDELLQGNT